MHRRRGQRPVCGGACGASQSWRKELRYSSCCGRPGHPFRKSSGEEALNSECSSYYKTINALLQLHPGMTRSFFFLCAAQKGVVCYKGEGKDEGVAALLACGGSIVDWRTTRQLALSFIAWIRGSLLQKCLWQMPVALQSDATPRLGQWVQTRRTWKWWCRWMAQREHSFCSVMLLVWNPALSWPKVLLARPVSPLPWPPWLGDLPSAVTDQLQKSVTSSLHLPSRHRQSSMLGQRWPNKLWICWCRRWAPSTFTSQTDDDWCTVYGEDDGFARWEPNSCSCHTWRSPTNCRSTFAH